MGLVLTRYVNEKIHIGDNIDVTVARIHNNQVSLHIEAPRDITILREEVRLRNLAEGRGGLIDGNL
jgi:carbon storage regulator